jgi:uncharacterized damage-inducible protein DinB
MYRKINDFINDWNREQELTTRLFKKIKDSSLNVKVYETGRTLGRIAWHIVTTIGEMATRAGLEGDFISEHAPVPEHSVEILSAFKKDAEILTHLVKNHWDDNELTKEIEMYSQKWSKGFTLNVLIKHLVHHRAQLTVLMRQAGLIVPGVYGPSKEEWTNYGFEDPMP